MSIGFENGIDSQVLDSDAYNLKEQADAIFEPDQEEEDYYDQVQLDSNRSKGQGSKDVPKLDVNVISPETQKMIADKEG